MLSRITIFLIVLVFIFSIFVANIYKNDIIYNNKLLAQRRNSYSINSDNIRIDDQLRHTFCFMQVSNLLIAILTLKVLSFYLCIHQITDIHLSVHFDKKKRGPDLLRFCTEYIDIIKPSVVLATGDLTDSRTKGLMGSTQFVEEWILYSDILNKCKVNQKTHWLDIKGNHGILNSIINFFSITKVLIFCLFSNRR